MAPRTDTNQYHRHVTYNMAKSIQISRVTSANMTHLTKILGVNCKHLSNNIIDPLFLWYLWVHSVKAVSQWVKYPNYSERSFVRSKKPLLEFLICHKNGVVHRSPFCLCSCLIELVLTLGTHLPLAAITLARGTVRETSLKCYGGSYF